MHNIYRVDQYIGSGSEADLGAIGFTSTIFDLPGESKTNIDLFFYV
jgi:hypothetical protein